MSEIEIFYDESKYKRVVKFFSKLRHTKGKWAGKYFGLQDWQKEILKNIFAYVDADGNRVRNTAYVEVPRKNGKSEFAAGLALYVLRCDNEFGAEIYSCANEKEQASLVFNAAVTMIALDTDLGLAKCFRIKESFKTILYPKMNSFYKALSAEAYSKHGYNPHFVVYDELHEAPNRDLWDVMKTGMGARTQPMMIAITTAGYDKNSICWEQHDYAQKIIEGTIKDPTFYGVIYGAGEKDDWTSEETWKKANPNYGVSVHEKFLKSECLLALEKPTYENTFKRLYLNMWTTQKTRFIQMERWDENNIAIDKESLKDKPCFGGLDLASVSDVAVYSLVFPPSDLEKGAYRTLNWYFIPEEGIRHRSMTDKVPYEVWRREGLIIATPGRTIDYGFIKTVIKMTLQTYDVRGIMYDRWSALQLVKEITDETGALMLEMGQGYASMSPPTKEFQKLILENRFHHGGDPVLRWMVNNVAVLQDPAGNIKPSKADSSEKIDGVVSNIMALNGCIKNNLSGSVYEERGLLTI